MTPQAKGKSAPVRSASTIVDLDKQGSSTAPSASVWQPWNVSRRQCRSAGDAGGDFAASINRGGRGGFSNTLPREGREPPRDTPRDTYEEGNFTYSYQMFNVGTLISATPRVDDSGSILLDFKAEQSRLADTTREGDIAGEAGLNVSAPSRLIAKPRCG